MVLAHAISRMLLLHQKFAKQQPITSTAVRHVLPIDPLWHEDGGGSSRVQQACICREWEPPALSRWV